MKREYLVNHALVSVAFGLATATVACIFPSARVRWAFLVATSVLFGVFSSLIKKRA